MQVEHTKRRTSRQRSRYPTFLMCLRASQDPRSFNNLLPDYRVLRDFPLTARELAELLGGRRAGAAFWFEGYVIGDEAWIDDDWDGDVYIRCHDIDALLARASELWRKRHGH